MNMFYYVNNQGNIVKVSNNIINAKRQATKNNSRQVGYMDKNGLIFRIIAQRANNGRWYAC